MNSESRYCGCCNKLLTKRQKKFCSPKCTSKINSGLIGYNKSEQGKKKSSENGKLTGTINISKYNGSTKHINFINSKENISRLKNDAKLQWLNPERRLKASLFLSERNRKNWNEGLFKNSKIGYGKSGYQQTKFGLIFYRSSYEKYFLSQLDNFDNIKTLERESIRIPYQDKTYVPDYLINNSTLIEIKPKFKVDLDLENTNVKIEQAISFCNKNNINWLLLTEEELFSEKLNIILGGL